MPRVGADLRLLVKSAPFFVKSAPFFSLMFKGFEFLKTVDVVDARVWPALYYAIRCGDTGTVEMLCHQTYSGKTEIAASLLPCCTFIFVKFYTVLLFTDYRVRTELPKIMLFNKRQHK